MYIGDLEVKLYFNLVAYLKTSDLKKKNLKIRNFLNFFCLEKLRSWEIRKKCDVKSSDRLDVCQSECSIQDGFCWGTGIYVLKKLHVVPKCDILKGSLKDTQ